MPSAFLSLWKTDSGCVSEEVISLDYLCYLFKEVPHLPIGDIVLGTSSVQVQRIT